MNGQLYRCEQCNWAGARDAAVAMLDPVAKATPGRRFTDRECPQCGYRCFPTTERQKPPFPLLNLVVEQDIGTDAWANIRVADTSGPFAYQTVGAAHMFDRDTNRRHATLFAAAGDLYEALTPMIRGASEADYYCPDDVAEDHTVLISVTVAELRAARAALLRAQASEQSGG